MVENKFSFDRLSYEKLQKIVTLGGGGGKWVGVEEEGVWMYVKPYGSHHWVHLECHCCLRWKGY